MQSYVQKFIAPLIAGSCLILLVNFLAISSTSASNETEEAKRLKLLLLCPLSNGFDYPVGKPNSKGYYNAQKFGKNDHLGDDWNGTGGGNTDLGDAVYAIADGIVAFSGDLKGGWGNVVRIYHNKGTKQKPDYVESIYAHLKKRLATGKKRVKKGDKIGTIGNANGQYLAHLHLENTR